MLYMPTFYKYRNNSEAQSSEGRERIDQQTLLAEGAELSKENEASRRM